MAEKTFASSTNEEIWQNFKACQARKSAKDCYDEALKDLERGDTWCCDISKKMARVRSQDGTSMRVHFCPRCGKYLRD